jgi:hypothetical protein
MHVELNPENRQKFQGLVQACCQPLKKFFAPSIFVQAFLEGFPTKILYTFLNSHTFATQSTSFILFDIVNIKKLREEYKL